MVSERGSLSTQRVRLPSHIRCVEAGDEKDGIHRCASVACMLYYTSPGRQLTPTSCFLGAPSSS
ncbi:uncharacterized protein DS421_4g116360 [Arachis hypogaea]|nr:uncharacterized protein DS421_4g116360 [Arachis hypogaea]